MKLHFLGAAHEVGRSAILVEGSQKILFDCGIGFKEGGEQSFPEINNALAKSLDRIVLSHAHLDHCGYLPALYAAGYDGKITLTKPTRDLIQLLLADYLRIQRMSGNPCLYLQEDVDKLLKKTDILEYGEWLEVPGGKDGKWRLRFQEAGHILGSAISELELDGKKIIYTGDINLRSSRLLEGAKTNFEGEVLIIESTYGAKADHHAAGKDVGKQLSDEVKKTLDNGGKVLIPTFAIGRGQEILFTLEDYIRSGGLPAVPIYLDGMIKKALKIYRHNAIYLKKEVQRRILTSDDDPFKSEQYRIPKAKDKHDVFEQKKAIILSTSGMLNGGPVMNYLEHMAGEKRNRMILVGYQATGTRGRALIEGATEIEIGHEGKTKKLEVKLQVSQAHFTAHSDHRELVQFAKGIKGLKKCFIVHGEGAKSTELAEAIETATNGKVKCFVPEIGAEYEI